MSGWFFGNPMMVHLVWPFCFVGSSGQVRKNKNKNFKTLFQTLYKNQLVEIAFPFQQGNIVGRFSLAGISLIIALMRPQKTCRRSRFSSES